METPRYGPADRLRLLPRCPACRRAFVWQESPHRPFCSLTCRLLDLGVWLDEGYRIPGETASPDPRPDERRPRGGG